MDKFKNIFDGVKGGWEKLGKKKRKSLITIAITSFILVITYSNYVSKVNYAPVFSNLDLQDAAKIVNDLKTKDIKYELENGGTDILIDEKYIDEYRLEVAINDMMPQNSVGLEIFSNPSLMMTNEDRKINLQRALQGELQRSIMCLENIESAKVHLVLAEESIWNTVDKTASASVILDVEDFTEVTNDMARGIVNLISGAVNNLPKENVNIIDTKGNSYVVNTEEEYTSVDLINQNRDIKRDFENELKHNLEELLGSAFGKDKIKVVINAVLDFNSEEKTTITYNDPVIRSQQVSVNGNGYDINDVTDGPIDDNILNVISDEGDGTLVEYNGTKNYELSEEKTTIVKAPGEVLNIYTSVMYDGILNENQRQAIINTVSTATGYSVERGDMISVEGLPFDTTYEENLQQQLDEIKTKELESMSLIDKYGDYIIFGILVCLGMIILISLIRIIFSKDKNLAIEQQVLTEVTQGQQVDIIDEPEEIKSKEENKKEKQIKDYIGKHPEVAADLIKAWIKD